MSTKQILAKVALSIKRVAAAIVLAALLMVLVPVGVLLFVACYFPDIDEGGDEEAMEP